MKKSIAIIIVLFFFAAANNNVDAQSWSLTGNATTDPATNFIGTTDLKNLKIRTNNIVRMNITSGGKVGIGNFTPAFKLDVKGGSINTDSLYRIGGNAVLSVKGNQNTFVGVGSGFSNSTGYNNTANGYQALYSNSTGHDNTANGLFALYSNTTGIENTAIGVAALRYNTTGFFNTSIGTMSLNNNTTASGNTAIGFQSLFSDSTGYGNTANGVTALFYNTTGYFNTASGWGALFNNKTGYTNTAMGYGADMNGNAYFNSSCFGNFATISASNQVRIGNISVSSIGGYENWTDISDGRFKKNVTENISGLKFIRRLRPVTYTLDAKGINNFLRPDTKQKDEQGILEKEKIVYSGFIAQEVEKAAKEVGYDFSGVDAPKNERDLYGLRYAEFVVPLVKAVQELDKTNTELKIQNEDLKREIVAIKNLLAEAGVLKSSSTGSDAGNSISIYPNPASEKITFEFTLNKKYKNASLEIYNSAGAIMHSFQNISSGKNILELNTASLSSGSYTVRLQSNEEIICTGSFVKN
ncbi:MAG: T9SS type A sorting domain-containing protein [Bacteroidia bacterium]